MSNVLHVCGRHAFSGGRSRCPAATCPLPGHACAPSSPHAPAHSCMAGGVRLARRANLEAGFVGLRFDVLAEIGTPSRVLAVFVECAGPCGRRPGRWSENQALKCAPDCQSAQKQSALFCGFLGGCNNVLTLSVRFRRAHPCTHPALATPQTQPRRACCSTGGGKGATQARVLPYLSFCATASGGALCEARSLRARPRVRASALVARVAAQAGCLPRCLALRRTRTLIIFSFAKVQRNETRRARHRDLPVQGGKRPGSRTCV